MAYGERRGGAVDHYGIADYFGFAGAGALGMVTAIGVDMRQSADTSALYVMNKWVASITQLFSLGTIPLYGVLLILMGVGAATVLYFQPRTIQSAFAQGFGVLAALMTIAPSDLGDAISGPSNVEVEEGGLLAPASDLEVEASFETYTGRAFAMGGHHIGGHRALSREVSAYSPADVSAKAAVYRPYETVAQRTEQVATRAGYDLTLKITFPDGLDKDLDRLIKTGQLRGRLHNPATKQTFNIFRSSGAVVEYKNKSIYVSAMVPGTAETTKLWARVECTGHQITVESFEAKQGRNATWEIVMPESNTPLFLQRLRNSYWF